MIRCVRKGWFLFHYDVCDDAHVASVEHDWSCEHGGIVVDGKEYVVSKLGLFSGEWVLKYGLDVVKDQLQPSVQGLGEADDEFVCG